MTVLAAGAADLFPRSGLCHIQECHPERCRFPTDSPPIILHVAYINGTRPYDLTILSLSLRRKPQFPRL